MEPSTKLLSDNCILVIINCALFEIKLWDHAHRQIVSLDKKHQSTPTILTGEQKQTSCKLMKAIMMTTPHYHLIA